MLPITTCVESVVRNTTQERGLSDWHCCTACRAQHTTALRNLASG